MALWHLELQRSLSQAEGCPPTCERLVDSPCGIPVQLLRVMPQEPFKPCLIQAPKTRCTLLPRASIPDCCEAPAWRLVAGH